LNDPITFSGMRHALPDTKYTSVTGEVFEGGSADVAGPAPQFARSLFMENPSAPFLPARRFLRDPAPPRRSARVRMN